MTLSKISRSKPYPFPSRQEKKNLLRGRHFGTELDSMVGGHLPRLVGLVFFWGGGGFLQDQDLTAATLVAPSFLNLQEKFIKEKGLPLLRCQCLCIS